MTRRESTLSMMCFEFKNIHCRVPVEKKLPCGHLTMAPCEDNLEGFQCKQEVTKWLPCGHWVNTRCFERNKSRTCLQFIGVQTSCGNSDHFPVRSCSQVPLKGRDRLLECSVSCKKYCARNAHLCGKKHACTQPSPPCLSTIQRNLPCRHSIFTKCSDPGIPPDYKCEKSCEKRHPCGHHCRNRCFEECGRCEKVQKRTTVGCARGHIVTGPCFEVNAKALEPCKVMLAPRAKLDCDHKVYVPCHLVDSISNEQVHRRCKKACSQVLPACGHVCQGNCGVCFQGRFHQNCQYPCRKKLVCGHFCGMLCSMVCPPCVHPCYNKCEHWECEKECGVPCSNECQEPCPYRCEHSACSNLCSEVCNKPVCYEACRKLLKCGHECIGFCGELCPPYCLKCTPEKTDRIDQKLKTVYVRANSCAQITTEVEGPYSPLCVKMSNN